VKKIFSSDKIYVAKSKIAAGERGVFASQDIKKNELIERCPIIEIQEEDPSNIKEGILVTYFFYFGEKKQQLALALGFGSIYNHSYQPNAKYKINKKDQLITFTALEDIKKDSEITFDYKFGNPNNKNPLWFEVN
jgi:uncharacterized protein